MRRDEARLRALAGLVVRRDAPLVSAVRGASMRPTLPDGVEIRIEAADDWRAGDVVAFIAGGGLSAHRVVHVDAARRWFVAHGDGWLLCDPPGDVAMVAGVVRAWREAGEDRWNAVGAPPARRGWRGVAARACVRAVVGALGAHVALARVVHAVLFVCGLRYLAASSGPR